VHHHPKPRIINAADVAARTSHIEASRIQLFFFFFFFLNPSLRGARSGFEVGVGGRRLMRRGRIMKCVHS
ncbi:hypothetical protein RB213_010928, partial [Colletotrichum asianum]